MACPKYYFLVEEPEETILLGPYLLDLTYLELVNDLMVKCKGFTPDHAVSYAIPGRSNTYSTIKSEAEMKHMMILHEARHENIIITKILPPNAAPSTSRFFITEIS